MKNLLTAYKVLATIVGLSIITLICVGVPLKYGHTVFPDWIWLEEGGHAYRAGEDINMYLGTAHGMIYMAFLLVAFALSRAAKWPLVFTALTLLCGTIPFLSFWAEFRAVRRTTGTNPELR